MHILLTNDDGIDAPGLAALQSVTAAFARVTVVAPDRGYSGCGHTVTNHQPIRIEEVGERRYKVYGTPADCSRLGLAKLAPDVDMVLSGVNDGGNLGVDVYMSGTVAAIREAVWLGKPGIAFSQYVHRGRERNWKKSAQMAKKTLAYLQDKPPPDGTFWNVNFPDGETALDDLEIVQTLLEPRHLAVDYEQDADRGFVFRSDYRNRPRTKGSDVDVCFGGAIAVSAISSRP